MDDPPLCFAQIGPEGGVGHRVGYHLINPQTRRKPLPENNETEQQEPEVVPSSVYERDAESRGHDRQAGHLQNHIFGEHFDCYPV